MDEKKTNPVPAGSELSEEDLENAAGGVNYSGNQKLRICPLCGGDINVMTGKCKACGK